VKIIETIRSTEAGAAYWIPLTQLKSKLCRVKELDESINISSGVIDVFQEHVGGRDVRSASAYPLTTGSEYGPKREPAVEGYEPIAYGIGGGMEGEE